MLQDHQPLRILDLTFPKFEYILSHFHIVFCSLAEPSRDDENIEYHRNSSVNQIMPAELLLEQTLNK